jgi:hypothetical protein
MSAAPSPLSRSSMICLAVTSYLVTSQMIAWHFVVLRLSATGLPRLSRRRRLAALPSVYWSNHAAGDSRLGVIPAGRHAARASCLVAAPHAMRRSGNRFVVLMGRRLRARWSSKPQLDRTGRQLDEWRVPSASFLSPVPPMPQRTDPEQFRPTNTDTAATASSSRLMMSPTSAYVLSKECNVLLL